MNIKKKKIGDIATIIDGDRGNNYPKQNEFSPSGYCLFPNAGNVTANGFVFDDNSYITQEKDALLRKGRLSRGDIVYTTRGTIGNVAYYSNTIPYEHLRINSGMVILRVNVVEANAAFLYQYLKSAKVREYFLSFKTGSAQPQLPIKNFSAIEIDLPDLPTQRRIASILSAYDDLIENNRRQIKLLEEAAQRLYREWFVELRFPGHEGVKVVDGVPEGWKKVTIADSLAFHIGGGWGKETTNGKNTVAGKVIRGTDINDIKNGDFGNIPLRYHTENDILKRFLHPNDIVFELSNGNINNIGRCLMIDNTLIKNLGCNTICASFCKLLRPHDEMISHLLYWEIQDMQNSGRMLPLKKHGSNGINNFDFDGFLKHEFLLPLERRLVQPLIYIMQKISNVQSQLVFLREARDRLLSKLMSGETEA